MKVRLGITESYPSMLDIYSMYFSAIKDIDLIWAVSDGETAIEKLKNQDIDILILDVILPKKSGIDVLKWLRSSNLGKKPKIIICSVVSNENIAFEAINLGASYYFIKPFDFQKLISKINELMNQQQ